MRALRGTGIAWALALVAAAPAVAHVDVTPTQVVQNTSNEFTVRVPNEREVPTTAVRIAFPRQVTVYALATPPPGWTVTERYAADGRLSGVVYRGRLGVNRYQDFTFLGTAFEPGTVRWRAWQTYADGRTKPWTTDPAAAVESESGPTDPGPAAGLEILPEGSTPAPAGGAADTTDGDDDGSSAGIWLGVIAIAFAAMALLATGFLWSTRPMRLPDDDADADA